MAQYTLVKKPLTITEVFSRGWSMCIATFWSVLPFSLMLALISVPIQTTKDTAVQQTAISSTAATAATGGTAAGKAVITIPGSGTETAQQLSDQVSQLSPGVWALIISLVVLAVVIGLFIYLGIYAALIKQIDSSVTGKKLNFIEALFAGFSKSFTIMGISILTFIIVLIGLALLVLPGIYIGVVLFFASLLPVVENMGVIDSLKESYRLVQGHWWRTFFSLFLIGLISMLYYLVIGAILGIVLAIGGEGLQTAVGASSAVPTLKFNILASIVMIIAQTILFPLIYSFNLSILYDLQARKGLTPVKVEK